ncbi:MAG: hypothetical protein D4R44_02540 [Actinobacteria bacterium]|nr:MAG: hypothetical protein D4R44_02540 [Actinomycetota bacterium]
MKKVDYKLLIMSIGISVGLVFFVLGMRIGLTGRDATNLPDAIEQISPGEGERVLRQSQIIVDFTDGYTATLTIDGIELPTTRLDELVATGKQTTPGAQIELPATAIFDFGNYIISYLPQQGGPITQLAQGEHSGSVRFWLIKEGKDKFRTYSWTFFTD